MAAGDSSGEQKKGAALIVNMQARNAVETYGVAREELERQGIEIFESYPLKRPQQVSQVVKEVVARGTKLVIVGGGDGTISAIVDSLVHRDVTLGILPLGTGNDLANALGIPLDVSGACSVIANGRESYLDLAEANGDFFVHSAFVGYPAHISHRIPNWLKRIFGRTVYPLAGIFAIIFIKSFQVRLHSDATGCELLTTFVIIGNGRYHPARKLFLPEESTEGKVFAYAPIRNDRLTLTKLALAYLRNTPANPALICTLSGEEIRVEAEPQQEVNVDGEVSTTTPLTVRKADRAIKVLVPRK